MRDFLRRNRFSVATISVLMLVAVLAFPAIPAWALGPVGVVWFLFCLGAGYVAADADIAEQRRRHR